MHVRACRAAAKLRDLRHMDAEIDGDAAVQVLPEARDGRRSRRLECPHLKPDNLCQPIGRDSIEGPAATAKPAPLKLWSKRGLDLVSQARVLGFVFRHDFVS